VTGITLQDIDQIYHQQFRSRGRCGTKPTLKPTTFTNVTAAKVDFQGSNPLFTPGGGAHVTKMCASPLLPRGKYNGGCTDHSTCMNTPGSYECVCDTGYKADHEYALTRDKESHQFFYCSFVGAPANM